MVGIDRALGDVAKCKMELRGIKKNLEEIINEAIIGTDLGYRNESQVIIIQYSRLTNAIKVISDTNSRFETYMCIETGVGGGTIHSCEDLMETEELAQEEANKRNNMAGQSWACTRCVPKYKPIEYRADSSFRDWRHCPVHGSSLHLEIESADSHLETYLKEKLEREKEED